MPAGELFNVATTGKNGPLSLIFSYSYADWNPPVDSISFKLSLSDQTTNTSIAAKADLLNSSVSFEIAVPDALTTCLLGCAGKALLEPLIECFNKDPIKYLQCLRGKGVSIAQSIAVCAIGCFVP